MKVLSVNAGSSSLKFQAYEMPEEKILIKGRFERIGINDSFYTIWINGDKIEKKLSKYAISNLSMYMLICFAVFFSFVS